MTLKTKVKAIFNACAIVKDQNYVKIIIESDCKIVIDVVLGSASCLWSMFALLEDIKLFLEDFPHVSIIWINYLENMTAHESVYQLFNIIRSDLGFVFEVSFLVEVVYNYEEIIIQYMNITYKKKVLIYLWKNLGYTTYIVMLI